MKATFLDALLGIMAALVIAAPLAAHHGTAAFEVSKDLTLRGTVTDWLWVNPHCFLKFDAMDDTGTVRNWAVEAENTTAMRPRGWTRTSFKAGDVVTVTLQPIKSGAPVGRIRTVMLSDGTMLLNYTKPDDQAPVAPIRPRQ